MRVLALNPRWGGALQCIQSRLPPPNQQYQRVRLLKDVQMALSLKPSLFQDCVFVQSGILGPDLY